MRPDAAHYTEALRSVRATLRAQDDARQDGTAQTAQDGAAQDGAAQDDAAQDDAR